MHTTIVPQLQIKAIIGLGNPGPAYVYTRHNIGFLIIDALKDQMHGSWQSKKNMQVCTIAIANQAIILIKPETFMNNSGQVLTYLAQQGIKQDQILVIHDELELACGTIKFKFDGSAKGHNGLKSIIAYGGANFLRLRFGIDRPSDRNQVPDYVLAKFKESDDFMQNKINLACSMIIDYIKS